MIAQGGRPCYTMNCMSPCGEHNFCFSPDCLCIWWVWIAAASRDSRIRAPYITDAAECAPANARGPSLKMWQIFFRFRILCGNMAVIMNLQSDSLCSQPECRIHTGFLKGWKHVSAADSYRASVSLLAQFVH